ncbi:MAG: sulfite exporter TauE/SafE family protein [Acidimicrobiales bacterium]|nr:sulfite exporter TauE/SafE family protein [Acidimicrobiales bacterium]
MGVWEALTIAVAALATSALSAVAGMGGGLILLTVMVALVEPAVAIPLHGAIQIASNSTRALTLRQHVVWPVVVRHSLLLVPAGVLGLLAADALPADLGRALIGAFALVAVWFPRLITPNPAKPIAPNGFVAVGALQGFLNIPIGATGPMIAPFFRSALEQRHSFIATFAAAQTIGHVVKVGVFTADGLDLSAHLWVVALSAAAVIVGTKLGARVLDSISEETFGRIFKLALTVVAARLVIVYVF